MFLLLKALLHCAIFSATGLATTTTATTTTTALFIPLSFSRFYVGKVKRINWLRHKLPKITQRATQVGRLDCFKYNLEDQD